MIGEYLERMSEEAVNWPALLVLGLLFAVVFPFLVVADLTRGEYRLPSRS